MNKYIVTTTINRPTKATLKFCEIADNKNFKFVIVGDTKTPDEEYKLLEKKYKNTIYLDSNLQEKIYPDLSNAIGWRTIQRRNIGFAYCYLNGADIITTIDDDNIPYNSWGDNILLNSPVEVNEFKNTKCDFFDPLSVTSEQSLWHRGFPIEFLQDKNNIIYLGKKTITPLVQANLWDGDPDIDAICRLSKKPLVIFDDINPYTSEQIMPFNSQNTFLHRSVMPNYAMLPHVGRMDDIWGAYILQKYHKNCIVFSKASVYQERNEQDLITNLENEIIGYRKTKLLLENLDNYEDFLPDAAKKFLEIYRSTLLNN
jgi:hypothetical protein